MTQPGREEEPTAGAGVTADVAEHALGPVPDESTVTAAQGQATAPAATETADVAGLEPTESVAPDDHLTGSTGAADAEFAGERTPLTPVVETAANPLTVFDGASGESSVVVDGARHSADEPLDDELPTVDPTRSAALTQTEVVAGVTRVVCPSCETVWEGNDLRPHAAWFCAQCQFPLFWANAGVRTAETSTDDALARLPGTVGRSTLSAIDCPNCGEHNPPDPTANCWRCHAPLTPRDPPPPQPAPQVFIAAPVIEPPRRRIWPWIVATGVLSLPRVGAADRAPLGRLRRLIGATPESRRRAPRVAPDERAVGSTDQGEQTMSGNADEAKGRVKEAAGALTDDDDLRREGKADQAAGKVKQAAEAVKDKVDDAVDAVKDAFIHRKDD